MLTMTKANAERAAIPQLPRALSSAATMADITAATAKIGTVPRIITSLLSATHKGREADGRGVQRLI
jgi:hypothetical protein